jgi:hypothetical protein
MLEGPKAWDLDLAIRWDLPDHGASYRTTLHNGVLTYVKDSDKPAGLALTVPAAALIALAGATWTPPAAAGSPWTAIKASSPRCSAFCSPETRTSTSSSPDW